MTAVVDPGLASPGSLELAPACSWDWDRQSSDSRSQLWGCTGVSNDPCAVPVLIVSPSPSTAWVQPGCGNPAFSSRLPLHRPVVMVPLGSVTGGFLRASLPMGHPPVSMGSCLPSHLPCLDDM